MDPKEKALPYKEASEVIGAEPDNQPESGVNPGGEIPSRKAP
jgi:hypothetical protein